MQVRALMEAAVERVADGGRPVIEIMIPLTVTREELALARSWVEEAVTADPGRSRGVPTRRRLEVLIGTMIETPRAALRAGEIAEVADFFSFGTNDLTQMTFGFSRDDVEGRMMSAYLEKGLLKHNPFETVDADGVGELVRLGVERGRATRPSLKIGVCGEHGGDPESIAVFADAGLRLRELLALPGAHRPALGRPGGAGHARPGVPAATKKRAPARQDRTKRGPGPQGPRPRKRAPARKAAAAKKRAAATSQDAPPARLAPARRRPARLRPQGARKAPRPKGRGRGQEARPGPGRQALGHGQTTRRPRGERRDRGPGSGPGRARRFRVDTRGAVPSGRGHP